MRLGASFAIIGSAIGHRASVRVRLFLVSRLFVISSREAPRGTLSTFSRERNPDNCIVAVAADNTTMRSRGRHLRVSRARARSRFFRFGVGDDHVRSQFAEFRVSISHVDRATFAPDAPETRAPTRLPTYLLLPVSLLPTNFPWKIYGELRRPRPAVPAKFVHNVSNVHANVTGEPMFKQFGQTRLRPVQSDLIFNLLYP